MLGAYQDESYRVLKSTHGVTLLLNLPVYVMNMRPKKKTCLIALSRPTEIIEKSRSRFFFFFF